MKFKTYITFSGEELLYTGTPKINLLEELATGLGDIWHSSFEQGYKNAFPEIVYQTAVFFWYGNDFDNLDECVSWRLNPNNFVIRKSVWQALKGFDTDFENLQMQALDFAYNALRNNGAIPLYIKGLFNSEEKENVEISKKDRYVFYKKNFKLSHSYYMLFRQGIWQLKEWQAFRYANKNFKLRKPIAPIPARTLNAIAGNPTVSYIIPTMLRQDFTLNLLEDLKNQTYKVSQVVVVDATPEDKRDESLYNPNDYPFEIIFKWQTTKGSCRARNEAIDLCTGDYIVFGDDDIRIPPNFIENHIKLLQTYNAGACNGLDIRADNQSQTLDDLKDKLEQLDANNFKVGATQSFSNANSCVKREYVSKLVGNDINYDGGYGEDSDFGISLTKIGATVLFNPFSTNLHLKPPQGGYRFWGSQAKIIGKKRKKQPWELDTPVKWIRPVPSPTIMYQLYKHFSKEQRREYKNKYFLKFLFQGNKLLLPLRVLKLPYRLMQFNKAEFYAKKLKALGKRTK
ncbi:glycosyltransferase family 2 protein [Hwangdonia lutea]|uniref:Glycosyltransferase family 2 protein n=1 Tax=Hwangdonia lutea TaxID=3075823 RepID=A0AA97EM74_9FLAO|nr:glycosyltransferase family 2 protein [Hwangdonia sp. SCSIO 19198]WOD43964.1 glycosyltransferase family 2 protein [Hwangdonia sp. SCSIO 19198]